MDTQILNGQMVTAEDEAVSCKNVTHGDYCIPKCNVGFQVTMQLICPNL